MIAHIKNEDEIQTVFEHCEGVANVGFEAGEIIGLGNTARLCGLLHDIGKNKEEFETYLRDVIKDKNSHRKGGVDHSSVGGQYLNNNIVDDTPIKKETLQLICTAILSHHGLIDMVDESGIDKYGERLAKKNIGYKECIENSRELTDKYDIRALFSKASDEIEAIENKIIDITKKIDGNKSTLCFLRGCLQRLITSILIDSDVTDTARFMANLDLKELPKDDLQALWKKYQKRLDKRLNTFTYDNKISLLRKQMSQECFDFAKNEGGIYRLPVPTGGGKTLASLRYALEHCILKGKSRIIYTAPFISILEQNADVIKNILLERNPNAENDIAKEDKNILEHHSNIVFDDNEESEERYLYLSESWRSPIILTTMVRFLEVLFSDKTRDVRRFNKLKNSVIIIDEVQNIPVSILNLFNTMINFLAGVCKATVILCSATQPQLDIVKRKILYSENKDMISNVKKIAQSFKRTNIVDSTRIGGYTTGELADFVLEKFQDNMLIILNTKSAVQKLYDELKKSADGIRVYQLTTYMCAAHRNDVIEDIKSRLGKEKLICVSTQLIEAGVDISFNNVIRSIAGMDSIIQAAGRCNRNGKSVCRDVYIINYNEENLSRLPEINNSKKDMEWVLIKYRKNYAELGDNYLSSVDAVDEYYKKHFFSLKNEMNYNIKDKNDNLFSLLSRNKKNTDAYIVKTGNAYPRVMAQAYKSAGEEFKVIAGDTIGVIVPYKDSISKIDKLRECTDIAQIKRHLRALQRYTVNFYRTDNMLEELSHKGALTSVMDGAVYILDVGFYKEFGVSAELENYIF